MNAQELIPYEEYEKPKLDVNKIAKILGATRVTVPEFEIFSNPIVNIGSIKQRRFNIIDRGEPMAEFVAEQINMAIENQFLREFILEYIKDHKVIQVLQEVIENDFPEHKGLLDKMVILK